VLIFHNDGFYDLMGADGAAVLAVGVLYGLVPTGRWYRGVKPADPKPRGGDRRRKAERAVLSYGWWWSVRMRAVRIFLSAEVR
jgi:hypothetical protein